MSQSSKTKKPIYDRRVNEILDGLNQGKTRDELAEEFGHSDYRSLDMYMRRRNFTWDKHTQAYVPKFDDQDKTTQQVLYDKTKRIIQYLSEGADLDEVAERVGLGDIETLGEYMTKKGYKWDAKKRTYIEMAGIVANDGSIQPISSTKVEMNHPKGASDKETLLLDSETYLPSIEWLHEHLPQLQKLIQDEETKAHSQFPRYKIRGDAKVKSIQMTLGLQAVANQFCQEFSIVQKEFYEVAIIECLIKYGYHFEVENLLKNS
jgi:hypothetical protein